MRASKTIAVLLVLALGLTLARAADPKLDPKRIINESNGFLKDKEPEMTEEEYALYQKVISMLATNPDFAVKLLEAMMTQNELPSPAFQFILGNAYYAAGQTARAEASYKSAVKRFPTFLRAWVNLGILYYSGSRYAEAVPCFSRAVELGDRDSSTLGLLGFCLQKQGDLISAELAYMQALSGDPANTDWKEGLLAICIEGKQFARAESLVRYLILDHPSDARYWLTYANVLVAENRKTEAAVLLETASGTGSATSEELALLGDLYAEQNLVPEAAEIYRKLLASSYEIGGRKLVRYAEVLLAADRLDDAERVLAQADPSGGGAQAVEIWQARADLDAARRNWTRVHKDLDALFVIDPLNGRALVSRGRAFEAEDDTARAALAFEEAAKNSASAYVASLELANIELKERHYARSVEYLERALRIEKSDAVEDFLARVRTLALKDG
jgi:tetratricopeptide (TPR) repeat protein